jgi:hypothetical protein
VNGISSTEGGLGIFFLVMEQEAVTVSSRHKPINTGLSEVHVK